MNKTNVKTKPSTTHRHDTPFFRTARCEYEQGLGQARPNKNTSEMQTHCRSEVPVGHNIFKN